MTEAYSISARLNLVSNAPTIVADLIRQMERLDKVIGATNTGFGTLAREMRALNGGNRGINATVKALEAVSKIRLGGGLLTDIEKASGAARQFATVQAELAASARQTATAWKEMGRSQPRAPGGGAGGPRPASGGAGGHTGMSGVDLLNTGMVLEQAGHGGLGIFSAAIKAEMEVSQQLAGLRMNTSLSDKDISAARAAAEAATRNTPGSTLAENLHHLVEAYTAVGDLHEAMEGLNAVSRFAYVTKNLPGSHHGDTSFAGMQAVETMQRFYDHKTGQVSMEAFNQQLAAMQQVALGTGGRVDGAAYLGFAKQSRVGGMVASDQYLYRDLPAMLIAQGGNRVGTGDAAVWNQLVTGKMTANAFAELQKTGLIDQKASWDKGQVAHIMDHLRNAKLFGENRVEWMRQEILGPNGALARQKIDPHDRLKVAEFLSHWASRQTGLGFLSEGVIGMEGINKEAGKIDQTTKNPMQVLQQYDPMQKIREFHAAENELLVTLGKDAMGPALEVLKGLTQAIRDMAEWGKAHPDAAKNLTLIGGGLSALAVGAGEAATVIFLGAPLLAGIKGLAGAAAPFAPGGLGAMGMVGAATGLLGLLGAVEYTLPRMMDAAAKWMGIGNPDGSKGGGKGLQAPGTRAPAPDPNSNGNYFFDWLQDKWKGFSNTPNPASQGPHPRYQHGAYEPAQGGPSGSSGQPIVLVMNGHEMGRALIPFIAPIRPWSGTTSVDFKAAPVFPGAAVMT